MTANGFAKRLEALETKLADPLADGPDADVRRLWESFYAWFLEVLQPFPEALALVQARVAGNSCTWKSHGKPEMKLWLLVNTAWHALERFPEAKRTAEEAFAAVEALAASRGDPRAASPCPDAS